MTDSQEPQVPSGEGALNDDLTSNRNNSEILGSLLESDNPAVHQRLCQLERIADKLTHIPSPEAFAEFDLDEHVDTLAEIFLEKLQSHLQTPAAKQELALDGVTQLILPAREETVKQVYLLATERACSLLAGMGYYVYFEYSFGSSNVSIYLRKPRWYQRLTLAAGGWLLVSPNGIV
jgi:hypothetical protein